MTKSALSCLALLLVLGVCAADKVPDISHEDLKKAIDEKKVVLIDVNGTESFNKQHIPGALDYAAHKADLSKVLPEDKNTLIVAYCGSEKCSAYAKAAEAATKLGYTNVKHYAGGIKGWVAANERVESVEGAKKASQAQPPVQGEAKLASHQAAGAQKECGACEKPAGCGCGN